MHGLYDIYLHLRSWNPPTPTHFPCGKITVCMSVLLYVLPDTGACVVGCCVRDVKKITERCKTERSQTEDGADAESCPKK